MSKALKARIKAAADKEQRPMANWCSYHLERLLDEMDAAKAFEAGRSLHQPLKVAEDEGKTLSGSIPAAGAPAVKHQQGRIRCREG